MLTVQPGKCGHISSCSFFVFCPEQVRVKDMFPGKDFPQKLPPADFKFFLRNSGKLSPDPAFIDMEFFSACSQNRKIDILSYLVIDILSGRLMPGRNDKLLNRLFTIRAESHLIEPGPGNGGAFFFIISPPRNIDDIMVPKSGFDASRAFGKMPQFPEPPYAENDMLQCVISAVWFRIPDVDFPEQLQRIAVRAGPEPPRTPKSLSDPSQSVIHKQLAPKNKFGYYPRTFEHSPRKRSSCKI